MLTVFHLAGSVIYALAQWLVILLITRFIGVEGAGYYALYLGFLVPVSIFTNHGLRIHIATDTKNRFSDDTYLHLRYLGVAMFFVLSFLFFPYVEEPFIYLVIILIKGVDSLSEIEYGNWNRNRVLLNFTKSQSLRLLLTLVLIFIFYIFGLNLEIIILAYPLSMLLVYIYFDKKKSNFIFSFRFAGLSTLRELFLSSSPLAFSGLLAALNVTVVRFFLDKYLDVSVLAEYVYLQYYFTVASIVVLSISQVSIPYFSKNRDMIGSSFTFYKNIIFILVYSLLFCVFVMFLSNYVTRNIYGVDVYYDIYQRFFLCFGSLFSFLSIFGNAILISMQRLRFILYTNLFSLLLTLVSAPILIVNFGLAGAFASFLVVNIALFLVNWYMVFLSVKRRDFI